MLPMIFGENLFDDLFNDAFERSMWNTDKALYGKRASQLMKTDVHETEEGYELNVDHCMFGSIGSIERNFRLTDIPMFVSHRGETFTTSCCDRYYAFCL